MSAQMSPRAVIEQLIAEAFSGAREPRSTEYRDGIRRLLLQRLVGKPLASPYQAGTASYDAFFAGVSEGYGIWANHVKAQLRFA